MAVSVVEELATGYGIGGTSATLTLTNTPQVNDVLIAVHMDRGNSNTISTVSGAGASWSSIGSSTTGDSISVWMGTAGSTNGNITITASLSVGHVRLYLIRGLNANTATIAFSNNTLNPSSAFDGPVMFGASGQIVLDFLVASSTSGTLAAPLPSSGWSTQTSGAFGTGRWYSRYRIPAASAELHQFSNVASPRTTEGINSMLVIGNPTYATNILVQSRYAESLTSTAIAPRASALYLETITSTAIAPRVAAYYLETLTPSPVAQLQFTGWGRAI
jgi:hypothetical protein